MTCETTDVGVMRWLCSLGIALVVCNKSCFQEFYRFIRCLFDYRRENSGVSGAQSRNKRTFGIEIGPALDEIHALYKYTAYISQRGYF